MQHRELEQKLADAKLQQASAILTEEQERNKKEKEMVCYTISNHWTMPGCYCIPEFPSFLGAV